jgi:uncharacterized protein (DUF1697 family)
VALVVFLRGVNVGGHRTFRPTELAAQLKHLDAINIGAAGTFVIRKPVPLKQLRAELARRLPFATTVTICHGDDIVGLLAANPFRDRSASSGIVRFVSVLPNKKRCAASDGVQIPSTGRWLVRVLGQHQRFIVGEYRRHMKTIGYLGKLDALAAAPVTTRNWNTISAIAKSLGH